MSEHDLPEEFRLSRVLDASPGEVFDAWTDPARLARWWGPRGLVAPLEGIAVDVRPGGTWRTELVSEEDGSRYTMSGTYREVRAPERLVFTWGVAESGQPVRESALITVVLTPTADGRTDLVLAQAGRHTPDGVAEMVDGWGTCLDRLTEHATEGAGPGFERHATEVVRQAELLAEAVAEADLRRAVPTCPGWTLQDLLDHVSGNLRSVGEAIEEGVAGVEPARGNASKGSPGADTGAGGTDGGADRTTTGAMVEDAERFAAALRAAGPEGLVEVWGLPPSPVAFWARRAAYDLLIHRADALLALGSGFTTEAELAHDALDELLELTGDAARLALGANERVALVVTGRPAGGDAGPGRRVLRGATPDASASGAGTEGAADAGADAASEAEVVLEAPPTELLLIGYRRLPLDDARARVRGDIALLRRWSDAVSLD